jgi:anthranilate phosphoribosyltransferase
MEEKIRYFGSKVDALIKGINLTRSEANELFRQILLNEQPDLQQGAFLAAITAKGATPEEIAGIWEAIYEIDTVKVRPEVDGPLVENCGTGMDRHQDFQHQHCRINSGSIRRHNNGQAWRQSHNI